MVLPTRLTPHQQPGPIGPACEDGENGGQEGIGPAKVQPQGEHQLNIPAAKAAGCPDVRWYEDKKLAYGDLTEAYTEGAAVLLKASHFSGRFDLVADYLREYEF